MSKPRKLGMKTTYIPNAKADMRRHKKVYLRIRDKDFFAWDLMKNSKMIIRLNASEQRREKEKQP